MPFLGGRGTVIFLITFASALLMELFTRAAFATTNRYQIHGWPKLVALWAAAGLVYALRSWFRVGQERTIIDKKTAKNAKSLRNQNSSLFLLATGQWS